MAYAVPGRNCYVEDFYGCCGACLWFFNESRNPATISADLEAMADTWKDKKSVALMAINEDQRENIHKTLLEFGCRESWGPLKNINSGENIYGYTFDLNKYREQKLAQPKVRIAKEKPAEVQVYEGVDTSSGHNHVILRPRPPVQTQPVIRTRIGEPIRVVYRNSSQASRNW